jgi:hypothetical protein
MSTPGAATSVQYDALALLVAMETAQVEAAVVAAVSDAVGHCVTCSLDVLKSHGVNARAIVNVRRSVSVTAAVSQSLQTIAQVSAQHSLLCVSTGRSWRQPVM